MDIVITTGLFAVLGLCYASLTLASAPNPMKRARIAVPVGSPQGFFDGAFGDEAASSRVSHRNQPADHRTVWRPLTR